MLYLTVLQITALRKEKAMNNNNYKKNSKSRNSESKTAYTKKDKTQDKKFNNLVSQKPGTKPNLETPYKNNHHKPAYEFIAEEDAFLREFLQKKLPEKSLNKIKSMLYHNQVIVNGTITSKYDYPVKAGQKVIIKSHGAKNTIGSQFLDIIYEDDEIIAINKPAGLLTIATDKEKELTAYHYLTEYLRERDGLNHIFILHRLDKDTSGVVIFAKNEELKTKFQDQWNKLVVLRGYIAIVNGHTPEKSGTIKSFLKETTTHLIYSCHGDSDGKLAVTHYEVIKENNDYSMLRIKIDTGRKNQIRVHMKDLGNPIIGDKKYGAGSCPIRRLGLHADKLIIKHPVTGKELCFEATPDKAFSKFVK